MRRKNSRNVRRLTGISLLLALAIALGFLANYVQFGPFSITLSLIPIVVSSILYGPIAGLVTGLCVGAVTVIAPATLSMITALQSVSSLPGYVVVLETILVCLVKMGLAGLVPGLVFKALGKKHFNIGVILSSLLAPICNTGLFAFFMSTMMRNDLNAAFNASGANFADFLFVGMIGVNFLVEFAINAAIAPALIYVCKYAFKNVNLGTDVLGKKDDDMKVQA